MKRYRYCKKCDNGTMQHKEVRYLGKEVGWERGILTILSAGAFEACLDRVWVCSECGKEEQS